MKCPKSKFFGHKWVPVFISGEYKGKRVKFIGTFCKRCHKGRKELIQTVRKQDAQIYGSFSEKFFDDPEYNKEE